MTVTKLQWPNYSDQTTVTKRRWPNYSDQTTVTKLQCEHYVDVLRYLVKICAYRIPLITTDLTIPADAIRCQSTSSRTVAMLKGGIEQSKVSEVLIWNMKADRVQKIFIYCRHGVNYNTPPPTVALQVVTGDEGPFSPWLRVPVIDGVK